MLIVFKFGSRYSYLYSGGLKFLLTTRLRLRLLLVCFEGLGCLEAYLGRISWVVPETYQPGALV